MGTFSIAIEVLITSNMSPLAKSITVGVSVFYNIVDSIWLCISPVSHEGIHSKIERKHLFVTLLHHTIVGIGTWLIIYGPGLKPVARLLFMSFYAVEVNTFFRDLRKFFNMKDQIGLYILCTILFDITWIVCRLIYPLFIVTVAVYWLSTMEEYVHNVIYWVILIFVVFPSVSLQLFWTPGWYKKFRLRICNYSKYYECYGDRQQVPQTDVTETDTDIEIECNEIN